MPELKIRTISRNRSAPSPRILSHEARRLIPMERRTLLIVDANARDRAVVAQHLRRDTGYEYHVIEAASIAEGVARIAEGAPDCIVLGDRLEDGRAIDFLQAIRSEGTRLPPAVIFTGTGDHEQAVELMKAGAQDYLVRTDPAAEAIRLAVNAAIYKAQTEQSNERLCEEARTANAAKDDFLAMLSHELRTPLTPVLSIVSVAARDPALTADLRETFAMIQRNVELEARLIDDLLDLTQIASGRLKIERAPVDVHRCIEAALDVCVAGFEEKRITVRTELAAARSVVLGDFARLNQMLWNLLKNAVKFTAPYGHVAIATSNQEETLRIEIRDDGRGIDPARLATIFGAFSPIRPQPTATGVGLGLAITRAIVEGHGGSIRAESGGEGHGTVFDISLPVSDACPASPDETPRPPVPDTRGKTLLVVEDHEDTRRALSRALRRRGFGVTAAGSVAAACEQYLAAPADLVICDIGLPDGTGWELMEKLRAHGPVKAIAVSGYGMDHDLERSQRAGFVAHLTKPIDFSRLETLIVEKLSDRSDQSDTSD